MPTIGPMRSHGSPRLRRRGAGTPTGRTPGPVPVTVSGLPGLLTQLTARPVIPAPPGSGAAYWLPPDNTRRHYAANCPAEPDSAWSGFVFRPFASASSDVLRGPFPRWPARCAAGPPDGRFVSMIALAPAGWVRASGQRSWSRCSVSKSPRGNTTFRRRFSALREGQARHRPGPRGGPGDVPGLGAQRRPGGSARSFGGDLGCGHCALRVADLDVPIQFPPGPARRPAAAGLPGRRERIAPSDAVRSRRSRRSPGRGAETAAGRAAGPVPVTVPALLGLLTDLTPGR